jgi:hypothetical protein
VTVVGQLLDDATGQPIEGGLGMGEADPKSRTDCVGPQPAKRRQLPGGKFEMLVNIAPTAPPSCGFSAGWTTIGR